MNTTDKYQRRLLYYVFFSTETYEKCIFPPSAARDPIDMVASLARSERIDLGKEDEDIYTPFTIHPQLGHPSVSCTFVKTTNILCVLSMSTIPWC